MPTRLLAAVFQTLLGAACDDDPPTSPSGQSGLTFGTITPASGGSVTTSGALPGAIIVRGPVRCRFRSWGPFRRNDVETVTISGIQVGRLPCAVTGVREYLHTRNNGLLIPPTASETAAEGSTTVSFTIR